MPTKRNPEGKFVTFRCPHDLRLDVERLADEHDVTLAQICRKGLRMVMTEMAVTTTADTDNTGMSKPNPFLAKAARERAQK